VTADRTLCQRGQQLSTHKDGHCSSNVDHLGQMTAHQKATQGNRAARTAHDRRRFRKMYRPQALPKRPANLLRYSPPLVELRLQAPTEEFFQCLPWWHAFVENFVGTLHDWHLDTLALR